MTAVNPAKIPFVMDDCQANGLTYNCSIALPISPYYVPNRSILGGFENRYRKKNVVNSKTIGSYLAPKSEGSQLMKTKFTYWKDSDGRYLGYFCWPCRTRSKSFTTPWSNRPAKG